MEYFLFFKIVSGGVFLPLSIFFKWCLEQGNFPESLKLSNAIPIFKSDAKCDLSNYHPLSLLSAVSKVLEKFILIRVMSFIEKHLLL